MFVVAPPLSKSAAGLIFLNLLSFTVLLGALRAAGVASGFFTVAAGMAAFAWVMVLVDVTSGLHGFLGPRAIATVGLWIGAPLAVLGHVLRSQRVTLNTVYGALAAYFLIGLLFGFMYDFIEQIDSEAFAFPTNPGAEFSNELVYYSLVTQTTLGFGDIAPMSALARTLTAVQAVVGQIYLVVLVARLVALQLQQETR